MQLISNKNKFLIVVFIVYLWLAPTPLLGTGLMRFIPTLSLLIITFYGVLSFNIGRKARIGTLVSCFLIYIIFNALFCISSIGSLLMVLLKSSYWCWVYYIAYTLFLNRRFIDKKVDNLIMSVTSLFAISFFYVHLSMSIEIELVGDNAVFYPLLMIPWIATMSSTTKRWLMLFVVSLCVFTSLKRSAFIILVISSILIYLNDFLYRKPFRMKNLFWAVFVILGICVLLEYKSASIANINERFEMVEDDGGSGRDMIYADVTHRYINGDIIQKVIGRGFDSVKGNDTTRSMSAHNDFLEVLYDFGIIGLFIYLLIHLSLIKWVIRLFRTRSQLAVSVFLSYVCFIVMSMVSHLVLYPTYFGLLTSFWAYAECKNKDLKCIN